MIAVIPAGPPEYEPETLGYIDGPAGKMQTGRSQILTTGWFCLFGQVFGGS